MREVVIAPRPADENQLDRTPVELKIADPHLPEGHYVLTAIIPKEAIIARASGVFTDKYASDSLLAKTAFDFLEASLVAESWVYVITRLQDRDDDFDTEHLTAIFEALFEEFNAQVAPNREARRAQKRPAARR